MCRSLLLASQSMKAEMRRMARISAAVRWVALCRLCVVAHPPPSAVCQCSPSAIMSATAAAPAPAAAASASAALPPTAPASAANAAASSTPLGSSAQTFADDSSSLSAFLLSGLPALYKHSSRKHEALRQACVEVISKIKAEDKYRQDKAAKG